jgi:hypothetical protein
MRDERWANAAGRGISDLDARDRSPDTRSAHLAQERTCRDSHDVPVFVAVGDQILRPSRSEACLRPAAAALVL